MPELEQSFSRRSGQITPAELQNPKPGEGEKRERRGITSRGRKRRDDFEGREEAEDAAELLQRAVIADVGDVGAEVVDGGSGEHALEFAERLEAEVDVVEARGVELEDVGGVVDERIGVFFEELLEILQVPISRHDRHEDLRIRRFRDLGSRSGVVGTKRRETGRGKVL